ncbi:MAG TPA: phosphopentomutase [Melioribacteraceae bacterium]|nr:phosphopentomutase [Melioribacteraceae bacterium]
MNNIIAIVLDGVGIGELPDSEKYGDKGSNTLSNMAEVLNGIYLPNLENFGLGNITEIKGIKKVDNPKSFFGKMAEKSVGKDSTTGHWELGGIVTEKEFPLYPNGFPKEIINKFLELTGFKAVLGNKPASGTEIIKELGDEHVKTGNPIVYTSGDSVFQIAAHEEIIPLPRLYEICEIARHKVMTGKDAVGRIIARPFIGKSGEYKRTTNRKDFSIDPTSETMLDVLQNADINTVAIGKINDLYNYRGINKKIKTISNLQGIENILVEAQLNTNSLIFANLVDFDVYYGHRNDPAGFYKALKEFDDKLPMIVETIDESDLLLITADHGNDPTDISTDHTREYVPILIYKKGVEGISLGVRETFADFAQTIMHFFRINNSLAGKSMLIDLNRG